MFIRKLTAGWSDMDFNAHMRNTAYLDKSADVRLMFFAEQGFPAEEFIRLRIGPVVKRDEVDYFKEVNLLEEMSVSLMVAGLSDNGSHFRLRNEFSRADGKLTARVTSTGGWLDLSARKLIAPPDKLLVALRALARTDDFEVLTSSLK